MLINLTILRPDDTRELVSIIEPRRFVTKSRPHPSGLAFVVGSPRMATIEGAIEVRHRESPATPGKGIDVNVELNRDLEALAPWDLSITKDGVDYPTRRPTLGLVARLHELPSLGDADTLKVLSEIFEAPRPDFSTWFVEEMAAALSHYLLYFAEQAGKNSAAVAASIRTSATAKAKPAKAAPAPADSSST